MDIYYTKEDRGTMGLFGSSKDKDTIQRLTQQIYRQKEEYEKKISQLENVLSQRETEMSELKAKFEKKENENTTLCNKSIVLCAGKYFGGKTIPIGIYNLRILSGTGIVETKKPYKIFERLESNPLIRKERNWSDSYNGLVVTDETILDIGESARITFEFCGEINFDDEAKTYMEKKKKIEDEISYLQMLADGMKSKIGDVIKLKKGVYYGGSSIPTGNYNLKILSGHTMVETSNPKVYFSLSKEYDGFETEYFGLEIKEGTKLQIDSKAEIEFFLMDKIEKNNLKIREEYCREIEESDEVERINEELKILNDSLINKYYIFSDYDGITSEECKNKLFILKQDEKELREFEKDVIVMKKDGARWKLPQRTTRQILRSFNMECDNIMSNVGLKNIDQSRKKIQQSFESLNKLYSADGVNLTKKILELKLEQITLMYTYELKYQQEKDIQRAVKEQMIEEAKAQREIEEQKKKIEKDLQQHLGEINRMMKYMQKTQIDVEKQLYMDKIKELEEKIKILESDKETVLEREANAKAGFVYIISNIGSFGENIYKIGMTRRLEPMDRVKELSSASVPFEFDVHAMIFSSDAPELETMLHRHFADNAVNKVNPRKEFYNVDIDEIEKVVKENYNDTVQFTKIPMAAEYRQSLNLAVENRIRQKSTASPTTTARR